MSELYKKRYKQFIKHRQENPLVKIVGGVYVEKHHIKPQSFFLDGTSQKEIDKDNTVYLTGREHFIAHCFLAKMYETVSRKWHKTNKAMDIMSGKSKNHKGRYSNSRLYEHLKAKYYEQVNKENEEARLIVINEICDFIDDNGKKPSPKSKNKEEKILGSKLSELKRCNETSRGIFYNSYLELAMKRGYPNLFKSKEDIRLMIIKDICDFIDKNNTYPKHRSTNKYESKLGVVLHQLRTAKNGTHGKFFDSYQDLAEKRNYPDLFKIKK